MKQIEFVRRNNKEFLAFLKTKYPVYHLSNVFFRDVQYGIQEYLRTNGMTVGYGEAEKIAREFSAFMEEEKIFSRVDQQTWVLNYPEFKLPQTKAPEAPKPAPKPAAAAPAAPPAAKPAPPRANPPAEESKSAAA